MQNQVSRLTPHASRALHSTRRTSPAFTLLELLMVIAIMGIVAALAVPTLRGIKPNAKVAATRQLLDAVGRARQHAISQRTTVYMVFLPTQFWADPAAGSWTAADKAAQTNLLDKQLIGYAYVTLRNVGDQPGVRTARYLSESWRTLPKGAFIPPAKFVGGFTITGTTLGNLLIPPFPWTTNVPFPMETNRPASLGRPYIALPYIAFDGTGELVSRPLGQPELIPVSEGSVSFARDPITRRPLAQPAQANEMPVGNTVDNYSLVYIDQMTGRARVERRKVQ